MTATKGKNFMIVAVVLGAAAAVVGYYGLTSMATQSTAQANANFKNVVVTVTDMTYGVKLDKEHQKADWSRRPLTPPMLAYAAVISNFAAGKIEIDALAESSRVVNEVNRLLGS